MHITMFPCIYVPHLHYLFSVDGHLGRFHVLAINSAVNSAAVNFAVACIFLNYGFRLGIGSVLGLLGHIVFLFLVLRN